MIVSRCKDIEEFKELHRKYADKRFATAEGILRNWDYHFCFYTDDGELTGCIYLEDDGGLLCLSGFSRPKNYDTVIKAIKWVSEFMKKDTLYSKTDNRAAKIVLMRCGFKKIEDELFMREAY